MGIRVYRPISPSQRFKSALTFEALTKAYPEKSLTSRLNKTSGRSGGKVTSGNKGGGHKRNYRLIDFKRNKRDIPAIVASIEYDPNRSANIALLKYKDGEKRYILAPIDLKVGTKVSASNSAEIKPGNCLPLSKMPIGTVVHNIEIMPGAGGQIVRSAGTGAIVAAKEGKWIHVKLPSKEVRRIHSDCFATVGQIGNMEWKNISLGKAGKSRHMGKKPHVRGVAMDPRSHPHGGGEAKSGTGMAPKTPWGKPAMGKRTRNRNKPSAKYIVQRRKK